MTAPDIHDIDRRQGLLEQRFEDNFRSFWKRYDDLTDAVKDHHREDDTRFDQVVSAIDAAKKEARDAFEKAREESRLRDEALRARFNAILASIVVGTLTMLITAAVFYSRGGQP